MIARTADRRWTARGREIRVTVRLVLVSLLMLLADPAAAAPAAEPWPRWQAHDPASTVRIDHGPFAAFLQTYRRPQPDGTAPLAYGAVTPADRQALQGYIGTLASSRVSDLTRPEQLAYWLNLRNALTIEVVLAHYPVRSVRDIDISPGRPGRGPWGADLVTVEGERLSLDDIEHRILRPIWRDPRVHYAIACAARGCPDPPAEPFEGERVEDQLDAAAVAFINHPRGLSIEQDRLGVSSLYKWYQVDFGGDEPSVIHHLLAYAAPETAMELQRFERIDEYRFDWALNDAR